MPTPDLTFTITSIIAVCALLSPILTAFINNHYQLKLRKLELEHNSVEKHQNYQRSVFENYLKYAGRCAQMSDIESLKSYGESYFLAFTYAPASIREQMSESDRFIAKGDPSDSVISLEKTSALIEQHIKSLCNT